MDPVTHGLIGASVSQSAAQNETLPYAALVGAAAAMLPDLDVLIGSASDPLLQLEFHRQFTHSLLFIPFGALVSAALLWWFVRHKLSFRESYFFSLLGIATAGLSDTFTSYGVQLLWPFTGSRYAWNLISVFDPLFSLGLILFLVLALYHKKRLFAWAGIAWAVLYLLFGWAQREQARDVARELSAQRNHPVEKLTVKPTIANELLWSIRYVSRDTLYADAVRLPPLAGPTIYEGQSAPLLNWRKEYAHLKGTVLYDDLRRFERLSEGILIRHPVHPGVVGDGRYALLPTSLRPLWGIEIDTAEAGRHPDFNTYRDTDKKTRQTFMDMLMGRRL